MQNPLIEDIAKKHGLSAQEVESEISKALAQCGGEVNMPEFLLALSEVLKEY